jgi:hypothetical protein
MAAASHPIRSWFMEVWGRTCPELRRANMPYSRHYTLEPFSELDVYETANNPLFEGPSRLINDDTGETVGVAVTESMDVRIIHNAPYAPNQH